MKTGHLIPESLRKLLWTIKGILCAALFTRTSKHVRRTIMTRVVPIMVMSLFASQNGANEVFHLTRDGEARVRIVYRDIPSDYPIPASRQQERFAETLTDFVRVIKDISGADLHAVPVDEAGEPAGSVATIQIGPTPAAERAGMVAKVAGLPPHALLIHCDPEQKTLYLLGSTLEGTGHAVYEFLEMLGCRWFYPGAEGEVIPRQPSISLSRIEKILVPEFERRGMQLTMTSRFARTDETRNEWQAWMRRNKFGGWSPPRGHNFHRIVGRDRFKENPEFFSVRDGKRVASHLCMTNPEVMEAAVEHLTDFFTQRPNERGFAVALADGAQYCECPDCTEACGGNPRDIMELYLRFTGQLFDRIDKKFPERELLYGFYVYSNLMAPPAGEVPKQLAPYFAPLGYDPFQTFVTPDAYTSLSVWNDFPLRTREVILTRPENYLLKKVREAIEGWGAGSSNLYLRDYDPYITFQQNMPVFRPYQLALEIPWYQRVGVRGFTPEVCGLSWFAAGLNHWVRSRLYWNIDLDIKAELTDMCRRMFGPAWEPMYGYFDALARRTIETAAFRHGDEVLHRLYSIEFVEALDGYLQRAEALATLPADQRRVRMWRLNQQHMLKYLLTRNAELDGNFVEAYHRGSDYLSFLQAVQAENPHYVDHRWYGERTFSMYAMLGVYRRLASLQNGSRGTLLTMLPLHWVFKHDPDGVGLDEQWFDFTPIPPFAENAGAENVSFENTMPGWQLMRPSRSWQFDETDYEGYNWFRNQVFIPENVRDETVRMAVNGIFGHMLFFVNGQRVIWKALVRDEDGKERETDVDHLDLGTAWSHNYNRHFDVDISELIEPGAINTFSFRSKDMWKWGGIFKNVFLYRPIVEPDIVITSPYPPPTRTRVAPGG